MAKKPKPGTAAELAELYPPPRSIDVRIVRTTGAGRDRLVSYETARVTIGGMPIEQLGRVASLLIPLSNAMSERATMFQFMAEHRAEVFDVIAAIIDWPVADVGEIHSADFLTLASAIIEENADFFVRLPGLVAFEPRATPSTSGNGAGPMPSHSFVDGEMRIPNVTPSANLTPQ